MGGHVEAHDGADSPRDTIPPQDILRLDYDTFVNASFFLQGKADQFAQQSPARRKEVLSSILGLGAWEIYKSRTGDRRHDVEVQLTGIEGRLEEIGAELAEGSATKKAPRGPRERTAPRQVCPRFTGGSRR